MWIVDRSGCKVWRQMLPRWNREVNSRITSIHTASRRYVITGVICMLINILQSSFIIYFLIFSWQELGKGDVIVPILPIRKIRLTEKARLAYVQAVMAESGLKSHSSESAFRTLSACTSYLSRHWVGLWDRKPRCWVPFWTQKVYNLSWEVGVWDACSQIIPVPSSICNVPWELYQLHAVALQKRNFSLST